MVPLSVVRLCAVFVILGCYPVSGSEPEYLEPYLDRHYKIASGDGNFDKFMRELGVGPAKRNAAKFAKPILTLSKNEHDEYTLETKSKMKTFNTTFKIGEEFQEVTPDGRKVTSLFIQDKNTLTEIQRDKKHTITITHVFSDDEIVELLQIGDLVSTRTYKYIDT